MLKIDFVQSDIDTKNHDSIVAFIDNSLEMNDDLLKIDQENNGIISEILKNKDIFDGTFKKVKSATVKVNNHFKVLILLGMGCTSKLTQNKVEELGAKITLACNMLKLKKAFIIAPKLNSNNINDPIGALVAYGATLYHYSFNKYHTVNKEKHTPSLEHLTITSADNIDAKKIFNEYYFPVSQGVFFARDCVSEVPNVLYPESYARKIEEELTHLGVEVTILNEEQMKKLNMNALLGVGQGSSKESKLVIMKYKNIDDERQPVALVGKGVCFDTGGISLKPPGGMWDMKYDMGGSAAVVGTMKALAARKAKTYVVGVVGLVENMPDGNAQRPGDVVYSASGKTIEVLNTDAEGRLVLADALWYVQKNYSPKIVVDLATLTGAVVVALGNTYAGGFANDDNLARQIIDAGEFVNEKVWRLPLHEEYNRMMDSDVADVANIPPHDRGAAGAITAAEFLQRFIENDTPWMHLDIAGLAWAKKSLGLCNKGAVGFGVRLLNQFIKNNHEL